jgi:hypothetical protein
LVKKISFRKNCESVDEQLTKYHKILEPSVGSMQKTHSFYLVAVLLASVLSPIVDAQADPVEDESGTFDYHTIASLGDSTLGSDPTGYRGPFATFHAANLMEVDYYEGAVGGDRTTTLIDAGRHTAIAENYGEGTLAVVMVGAWDFIDSDINIVNGDYSFIDNLEENMTIILDTLTEANVDVLVWNLPNMSFLPFLTQIFPTEVHPYFTEASFLWADRLSEIAESYGESVKVFDLRAVSDDLLQNTSSRMILGNEVISPPEMCIKNCIMVDSLHPTSVGQGLLANYMMNTINQEFPSSQGNYPLLSDQELLNLTNFNSSVEEEIEKPFIEGDITQECFEWTETSYRDMYLTITIDGEDLPIPEYIGFNTGICKLSTHVMYTGPRVIHVVTDISNNLTLNDFFKIWDENFSSTKIMDLELKEGGSLDLTIDLMEFEGDWSAISIEGVNAIEIIYTSPPTPIIEDDTDERSLPGFSLGLALSSILLAMAVLRREY